MEVTFEDSGTPLKKSRNRKGETSGEQLRRMVREIADSITNPVISNDEQEDGSVEQHGGASEWMEGVYDIRYIVDQNKMFLGAEILVAGGGPTIWVDTFREQVTGWWGSDRFEYYFQDNMGLNDYMEEMYG